MWSTLCNRVYLLSAFVVLPWHSISAQFANSRDYVFASGESVAAQFGLTAARETDPEDSVVLQELRLLNGIAGGRADLWMTATGRTSAHPDVGIIINRTWIATLRARMGRSYKSALRFIVAHERAHITQYAAYGARSMLSSASMTPVYEAQADILAGYYFSLLLPRPDPAALDTEEALNAQRIAFDLGVEQYAVAAHPPHEARLTAARLGMMAGLAERFSSDPNRRVSMRSLNAKLQRPPGMPLLDWTLKAAKLVARHNKSAVSSLVADEQATIKWNTSGSNPIVDYKTSYQNTGDRTIDVTLQVNVHIVPRSNPSATSEWKVSRLWHTATVKEWTFRLKPNARHTVSGRLRWVPLDPEETKRMDIALTMPAIRIPPDVMSLISADFADEHDSSRQSDTKDGVLDALAVAESINPLSDAADSAAFFTLGVRSIVSDAINKFTNIRAGMGKRSGDDIVFPSSILPLGALEATVWKVATDDENYVSVDLYDGPSRQAAEQKMAQVTSWLETAFSTAPASFSTTSTLHSANFHSDDAHVNLRVVLRTTRAGGYDVALYVEPSDE